MFAGKKAVGKIAPVWKLALPVKMKFSERMKLPPLCCELSLLSNDLLSGSSPSTLKDKMESIIYDEIGTFSVFKLIGEDDESEEIFVLLQGISAMLPTVSSVSFPKDPALTREQMIDTYLNTLATVLGRFYALEKARQHEEAIHVFHDMRTEGIQPTIITMGNNSTDDHRNGNDDDSVAQMKAAEEALATKEKQKPSFELSGKLAAETNRVKGVTLLFTEPPDGRKPEVRWRLYVF
ncbi:hypothetical protein L2E82_06121 [Cichorium intybus]|uniref:Uncharacterized protein n=1 Tax=Cichorium intybus TaxID=13427 RepID=A0ACB9H952_CICIN|nr:hypothetical protein L2E82_06121 [Cichorium intybus]